MTEKLYWPIPPGEILREDFLDGFGITQHKLAVAIGVPPPRITADTALRLGRYFGVSAQFWTSLQARYDLEVEMDAIGDSLDDIQPLQTP